MALILRFPNSPQIVHLCQLAVPIIPTLPPADRGYVENIVAANECVAVFVLQLQEKTREIELKASVVSNS